MSAVIPDPATTDWVPLGGIGIQGGLIPISEIVLGAAAASIDFPNIPQGYRDLMLVVEARTADAATFGSIALRLNGDNTATYASWGFGSAGTAALALDGAVALSTPVNHLVFQAAGNTATANVFGSGEVRIPGYADTAKHKSWFSRGGVVGASPGASHHAKSGRWASTAAINRVEVICSSGLNLAAGSRATLYGVAAPGVTYLPQATRVVAGSVLGNGTKVQDVGGFSVSRSAVGQYTVTFSTPFTAVPVVVATLNNALVQHQNLGFISAITANGFTMQTTLNASGTGSNFTDYPWAFHAIGT